MLAQQSFCLPYHIRNPICLFFSNDKMSYQITVLFALFANCCTRSTRFRCSDSFSNPFPPWNFSESLLAPPVPKYLQILQNHSFRSEDLFVILYVLTNTGIKYDDNSRYGSGDGSIQLANPKVLGAASCPQDSVCYSWSSASWTKTILFHSDLKDRLISHQREDTASCTCNS